MSDEMKESSPEEVLLTDADIARLRKEAKEKITKERRMAAQKALLEQFEEEERIAQGLPTKAELREQFEAAKAPPVAKDYGPPDVAEDDKVQITIGLPPFCDSITVDGKIFFDGHTHWVSQAQYLSLVDQMQMSWAHEDQTQAKSGKQRFRTRQRDAHLLMGPVTRQVINTSRSFQ